MSQLDLSLEPEIEAWLRRVLPNVDDLVEGASDAEIAALEEIAGRPLPRFYRWFLARMGRSMGPLKYRSLDFSAARILSQYRTGTFRRSPRFLFVAHESDPIDKDPIAYDFDHLSREDARAVRLSNGAELEPDWISAFETLREMLGFGLFLQLSVMSKPRRVSATLSDEATENVPALVTPLMHSLGFSSPLPTGPYCLLFERPGAAMALSATLDLEGPLCMSFELGAQSEVELRGLLGQIVLTTGMTLDHESWDPA
jgi:hypothetical protein